MAPNVSLLMWLLVYPTLGLELQPAETAASTQPDCEELSTSLAVNQLAILQLMRDGSHPSSDGRVEEALRLIHLLEAEHLNLRGEINNAKLEILRKEQTVEAGQQRCLQETLDAVRDEINTAKEETIAGITEREARQQKAAAERDAKIDELLLGLKEGEQRRSQETVEAITAFTQVTERLEAGQHHLSANQNATQETITGLAAQHAALTSEVTSLLQEMASNFTSLREEVASQGRLLKSVHESTTCPDGWLHHDSSCYLVDDTKRSWEASLEYCRGRGGEIAKITSAEEQEFIKAHVGALGLSFSLIGLNDRATEGHFVWTDGSAPTYTAWGAGQPDDGSENQDCVYMRKDSDYKWYDYGCSSVERVVCERPVNA